MESWDSSHWSRCVAWLELEISAQSSSNSGLAMALLHPMHYFNRTGTDLCLLLSPPHVRQPSRESVLGHCQLSRLLPGVECSNVAGVSDHWWPFSLGGVNVPQNRVQLCRRCNEMKSNSVLLWPWKWP